MDNKKRKITKADGNRILIAIESIKTLTERTKKYQSTLEHLNNVTARLDVLKVYYAAHLGVIELGDKLPFNFREWRATYTEAKMIYNYARKPKDKKDTAPALWEKVSPVFVLVLERAAWLEGKEYKEPELT